MSRPLHSTLTAVACAAAAWLALGAAPPAPAADSVKPAGPGYVDGSAFAALAGEGSELVEVNVPTSLLRALARGSEGEDPEAATLLGQLESIRAVILGLNGDAQRTAKAEKLIADLEARLGREGWEALTRVREAGERVAVLVRNSEKTIDGLTILAFDRDEGEVVFVNIAGIIDLARIGALGDTFDIPGLKELEGLKRPGDAEEEGEEEDNGKPGAGPPER
jgi:hypothetical protein